MGDSEVNSHLYCPQDVQYQNYLWSNMLNGNHAIFNQYCTNEIKFLIKFKFSELSS